MLGNLYKVFFGAKTIFAVYSPLPWGGWGSLGGPWGWGFGGWGPTQGVSIRMALAEHGARVQGA